MAKPSLIGIRSDCRLISEKVMSRQNLGIFLLALNASICAATPAPLELLEARELLKAHKWNEAVVVFRGLLKLNPQSLPLVFETSEALLQAQRREEAITLLQSLSYLEQKTTTQTKQTQASPPSARKVHAAKIQRKTEIMATVFYTQENFQSYQDAMSLLSKQKWKPALDALSKLLEIEPDNTLVLVKFAQVNLQLNRYDSAVEKLKAAIRLNPHNLEIKAWLGRALFFKGELDLAEQELRSAVSLKEHLTAQDEKTILWLADLMNMSETQPSSSRIGNGFQLSGREKFSSDGMNDVSPKAKELNDLIERYCLEVPDQASALLLRSRQRLSRGEESTTRLFELKKEVLKAQEGLDRYFGQKYTELNVYTLDVRPSKEQLQLEYQKLLREIELKLARTEKRGA